MHGWAVESAIALSSLLVSAFLLAIVSTVGPDRLSVPRRQWIFVAQASVLVFAALRVLVHFHNELARLENTSLQMDALVAKHLDLIDKKLAVIRNQTSTGLTNNGLSGSFFGVTKRTSAAEDAGLALVCYVRLVNAGPPAIAWHWSLKLAFPEGKSAESLQDKFAPNWISRISGAPMSTPFYGTVTNLAPNDNLAQVLSSSPLPSGAATNGWIAFQFDGVPADSLRSGTKLDLSLEDGYGRKTVISTTWESPATK